MNLEQFWKGTSQERQLIARAQKLDENKKLSDKTRKKRHDEAFGAERRILLRRIGIVVGGTALLAATGEIGLITLGSGPEPITEPKIASKYAPLADYVSPQLVESFGLQELAPIPAKVYELATTDGIPTSIHVYHPSAEINIDEIYRTYELFDRRNLAKIVDALKEGRTKDKDYSENPKNPEEVLFQYQYSDKYPPLSTGIFPFASVAKQRVMLFVSENNAPQQWSKEDAITGQYLPPEADPRRGLIFITVINVDRLKARGNNGIYLTGGVITEICNQSVKALAINNGEVAPVGSTIDTMVQEGTCNTFGFAGMLRRAGISWSEADRWLRNRRMAGFPGVPEPLRTFQLTEAAYNLMPSTGALLK